MLVALLSLSSWCLVIVVSLFLTVFQFCLQFVIMVFPEHSHLLFMVLKMHVESSSKSSDSTCILKTLPGKLDIKKR